MNLGQLLHVFFADDKLKVALLVIFIDFVLGVLAAIKQGNFRFAYVSDFLRNDVGFKLAPWFVLYAGALVAGGQSTLLSFLDMGVVAGAAYATIMTAWVASILGSLNELRIADGGTQTLGTALTGAENSAPPKD